MSNDSIPPNSIVLIEQIYDATNNPFLRVWIQRPLLGKREHYDINLSDSSDYNAQEIQKILNKTLVLDEQVFNKQQAKDFQTILDACMPSLSKSLKRISEIAILALGLGEGLSLIVTSPIWLPMLIVGFSAGFPPLFVALAFTALLTAAIAVTIAIISVVQDKRRHEKLTTALASFSNSQSEIDSISSEPAAVIIKKPQPIYVNCFNELIETEENYIGYMHDLTSTLDKIKDNIKASGAKGLLQKVAAELNDSKENLLGTPAEEKTDINVYGKLNNFLFEEVKDSKQPFVERVKQLIKIVCSEDFQKQITIEIDATMKHLKNWEFVEQNKGFLTEDDQTVINEQMLAVFQRIGRRHLLVTDLIKQYNKYYETHSELNIDIEILHNLQMLEEIFKKHTAIANNILPQIGLIKKDPQHVRPSYKQSLKKVANEIAKINFELKPLPAILSLHHLATAVYQQSGNKAQISIEKNNFLNELQQLNKELDKLITPGSPKSASKAAFFQPASTPNAEVAKEKLQIQQLVLDAYANYKESEWMFEPKDQKGIAKNFESLIEKLDITAKENIHYRI